jgi:hypothetical protein
VTAASRQVGDPPVTNSASSTAAPAKQERHGPGLLVDDHGRRGRREGP